LDKLEFIDGDIVNVVDYKTGKPKTRNELMGETKNANGDYYRQLVFYKLLLKYWNDGKYNMQSGIIDFNKQISAVSSVEWYSFIFYS
jgi:DNA helicase-2/ATP-dependent DNA helicase PcrA